MHPTKAGNTQVYSPLGSFVVEQHGDARHDAVKQRYASDNFRSERGIAVIWSVVIASFLIGAIYNRLGKPEIAATSSAEASIMKATGKASNPSKERPVSPIRPVRDGDDADR